MIEPLYLGDGVYVKPFPPDPSALVLTTSSHLAEEADNRIVLEGKVVDALLAYIERWRRS